MIGNVLKNCFDKLAVNDTKEKEDMSISVKQAKQIWKEEVRRVNFQKKQTIKVSAKGLLFPEQQGFSIQSVCIKAGNIIEKVFNRLAKESNKVNYHELDHVTIPGKKNKVQIDLAYSNKYYEIKCNIDFDTEKNPAVIQKLDLVAEHLSKQSLDRERFAGKILVPTMWEAAGYKYFKEGQEDVTVGVKSFFDDIGLDMTEKEYKDMWAWMGKYSKGEVK